jgi:hypothetical protein
MRRQRKGVESTVGRRKVLLLTLIMAALVVPASSQADDGLWQCSASTEYSVLQQGTCIRILFDEFRPACFINSEGLPVCAASARVGASATTVEGPGGKFWYRAVATARYEIVWITGGRTLTLAMPPRSESYRVDREWSGTGPASHTRNVRTPLVSGLRGACIRFHATITMAAEAKPRGGLYTTADPALTHAYAYHQHTRSSYICPPGVKDQGLLPPLRLSAQVAR